MRVPCIAVATPELTAAIGIDRPVKRHGSLADTAVQQGLRRQREVFNIVAFADGLTLRRQASDTDKPGFVVEGEQGESRHVFRRLFAYGNTAVKLRQETHGVVPIGK